MAGASVIRGSVKAEATGAALRDLLAELARMRDEPVPADELQEARDGIVLGLPAGFASVEEIAGHLGELAVHQLPDDYWNGFAQAVEKVTAADVQRAARRYLDPRRMTLVVVGASGTVRPQLGGLPIGPVEAPKAVNGLLPRKLPKGQRPAATPEDEPADE
jgi:predicted Zn-dependent peptidase